MKYIQYNVYLIIKFFYSYDRMKVKLSVKCIKYPGILIVQQSRGF